MAANEETATYVLALRDEISGAAKSAEGTLAALQTKIRDDEKALGELQRAMRRLKAGGQAGGEAYKELRDRAAALRATIAGSQSEYVRLGGTFRATSSATRAFAGELSAMPGPLGAAGRGITSLLASTSSAGAVLGIATVGAFALIAALGAFVVAVGAAATALLSYGVAHADARRNELLHLEGLTTIRHYYRLAAGSATEMQAAIDRVSSSTALGRGDVARYSEQLYRMGLRGRALTDALEGTVTVAAVQGERWARRFAGMAAGAAATGRSVRALADDVRTRLGGIATRQALALDVQVRHLREGIASIFDGLRIEGFLRGLNEITSAFSQSTVTGRALRTIAETVLNPILDAAGRSGPMVREFFEGMVIGALRLTIVFLRARNALLDAFGDSKTFDGLARYLPDATTIGKAAILGVVAAAVTATIVMGALATAVAVVAVGVLVLAAPILLAGAALGALVYAGVRVVEWIRGTDWTALGASIAAGLVAGIERGRDRVVAAVRGLASSATSALTGALGIQSPSRVFARLGVEIPRGVAVGVDAGAPEARRSVDSMGGGLGRGGFTADEAPIGGASTSTSSTSIGPFYIEVRGEGGEAQAQDFAEQLARALEGLALTRGAT